MSMDHKQCIFCGIESNNVVIRENGYCGVQCPQCGLIYISPRPSFSDVVELYGKDSAHISAQTHISNEYVKRLYARHHLKIISSFVTRGSLLEIGSGAGFFLDEARKTGFQPYGLELNPIQAKFIRNSLNIPCSEEPLSAKCFPGQRFDVIYHSDVISHLSDPISDFATMHQIMSEDSYLVFETGNLGEVNHRYFKYYQRFQFPDHLFLFGTANLAELLQRTGFEVCRLYRYSILPQLLIMKALSLTKNKILHSSGKAQPSDTTSVVSEITEPKAERASSRKLLYQYFNYVLRYKVGSVLPKSHLPQTVLVVAKKSGKTSARTVRS